MRNKLAHILALVLILAPFGAALHAVDLQSYTQLAPLPFVTPGYDGSANGPSVTNPKAYVEGIVKLAIGVAGVMAVLMLIFAGFQYITTENFLGKSKAKEMMKNALWGLILAIGAVTILQTINPRLVEFTLDIPIVGGGKLDDSVCLGTVVGTGDAAKCVPISGAGPDGTVFTCDKATPPTCDYSGNGNSGSWGKLPNGVDINGIPLKTSCESFDGTPATATSPAAPGFACQVKDQQFFLGLLGVNSELMGKGLAWHITEAWPPSYKQHVSSCHKPGPNAGGCVDASLDSKPATPAQVKTFLEVLATFEANGQIGSFQYEIPCPKPASGTTCTDPASLARYDALNKITKEKVTINIGATGEHAHINAKGINDSE